MSVSVIVGLQWGDEGKGKITDLLSNKADYIVRYQGGNNAGHSINIGKNKFILHLIPSGIIHKNKICIIGPGVVINPASFINELNKLESKGINTKNIFIDKRAHIIFDYHELLDKYREELLGDNAIGTTCKGIGPTYEDKIARIGIRAIDFFYIKTFKKKLLNNIKYKNLIFNNIYNKKSLDFYDLYNKYIQYAKIIKPKIIDGVYEIHHAIKKYKNILFEGAQGIMLDISYGTYPYVTTSSPSTGGVSIGCGIPPNFITNLIGVTKAYCTRVGYGAFPTELKNDIGKKIRKLGNEYGTTTGRLRRCGWLDLVALKYACMINGINKLILTKLDVLSIFNKIKICIAYLKNNKTINYFPSSDDEFKIIQPKYITFEGWMIDISNIKKYENLPKNCKKYIEYIELKLKIKISIISIGPERDQNIIIN